MTKSISGQIFNSLETIWQNFRTFLHRNETVFDVIFLLVYFFEQFALVYFTIKYRTDIQKMSYAVTFYSLIILTTVGIHRLFMESKNRYIKERHIGLTLDYHSLQIEYNSLLNEYKEQSSLIKGLANDNELLLKENEGLRGKIKKKESI